MSNPKYNDHIKTLQAYESDLYWFQRFFFPTLLQEALHEYSPETSDSTQAFKIYDACFQNNGWFSWLGKLFLPGLVAFEAEPLTHEIGQLPSFTQLTFDELLKQGTSIEQPFTPEQDIASEESQQTLNISPRPTNRPVDTSETVLTPRREPQPTDGNDIPTMYRSPLVATSRLSTPSTRSAPSPVQQGDAAIVVAATSQAKNDDEHHPRKEPFSKYCCTML